MARAEVRVRVRVSGSVRDGRRAQTIRRNMICDVQSKAVDLDRG